MRTKLALAATLAVAAIGSAAPAQAHPANCDERLEQLEERFREIEAKRGYDAATKWWERRWHIYYERCLAP